MVRPALVLVVVVLVLAACSDSDNEGATGASDATTTSATTAGSNAASSAETAPVGDGAPTTTLFLDMRAEVERDLTTARAAFLAAAQNPAEPDNLLDQSYFGPELVQLRQRLAFLSDAGSAARPGEAGVESIFVELIAENGDGRLNVTYCMSTDAEVFDVATGALVLGGLVSNRRFALVTLIDGRWMVDEDDLIDSFEEIGCFAP